ncbi:CatB-related O-acetyltransferase [Gulosibacter sediminis]|uniref:CatB-related O-acetyltransferase n=1 Tax=Gulosibacter sediminis TaxID=1729695 RepID=UPI0018676FCE|nr:CatB-related O-acetyltransferase [Gulosibacter sediminis]
MEFPPHDVSSKQKGIVSIGNDVWIGWRVSIAQGVTIGDGAIIAGNSHVVKDVDPYTIVGGNPAQVIRPRFSNEIITRFLDSKWWDYGPKDLPLKLAPSPEDFLDEFESRRSGLEAFTPGVVDAQILLEASAR